MNEDEAWKRFQDKTGQVAKSGASIDGKFDTLAQILSEIQTDTSRTAETVIPQLQGDQSAIDAANEQASMGAPDMGAPAPDMGAPDMGAPAGADPMAGGMPPADLPEMIPSDDMGHVMPPEGTPALDADAATSADMGAPDMGAPAPAGMVPPTDDSQLPIGGGMPEQPAPGDEGFDLSQYSYSSEDALNDFLANITDSAHEALDNGETEKVAAITGFIDGVKRLWAEYMGGGMPIGLEGTQQEGLPEEVPAEVPAEPVPEPEVPAETPAEAPAPAEESEGGEKEESKDKSEDKKDDKKGDDVKKSDCGAEEPAEKSEDAPAEEGGEDIAESEDKADGKTCIEEGMKKSFSFEDRMAEMSKVMADPRDYTDMPIPMCKSEYLHYEPTPDVKLDFNELLEEFKTGSIVKSSRPSAESAMGGFKADTEEAEMRRNAIGQLFSGMAKSMAEDDAEVSEAAAEVNRIADSLRVRRNAN